MSNQAGDRTQQTKKAIGQEKIRSTDYKVMKMFLAITLLFVASFLPSILEITGITNSWFMMYTYFLNHFGNATVYFIVDKEFREEVFRLKNKIIFCTRK